MGSKAEGIMLWKKQSLSATTGRWLNFSFFHSFILSFFGSGGASWISASLREPSDLAAELRFLGYSEVQ
ncbi:FAD binding domain-containing protein [Histoplasma ohiense]|nr:FAD binding domain-containing protein [Histoplasma ohiense (nom. inval.)]